MIPQKSLKNLKSELIIKIYSNYTLAISHGHNVQGIENTPICRIRHVNNFPRKHQIYSYVSSI